MIRRYGRHAPLALMLLLAVIYRGRQTVQWIEDAARGEPERDLFLDRCIEVVPENALIYLEADSGLSGELYAAGLLYPRRVIGCRAGDVPAEARAQPDTWLIVFPEPFDASRAVVEKLRDGP